MKIEQIDLSHLDAITPVFDAYRVWYRQPTDLSNARTFLSERIRNQESIIYGAFNSDKQLVGFTQLYPLFSSTRMGRLWLLNDLFVKPEYRGQGISLLLIERVKVLANETNAVGILLETEKSNQIGNQLYPRAGFHLEEETHYYFWKNEEQPKNGYSE